MNSFYNNSRRTNLGTAVHAGSKPGLKKLLAIAMVLLMLFGSASSVYAQDTSIAPDADNVYIENNVGQPDTITVTGLNGGDIVKVYNSASGGTMLGTATVSTYGYEVLIKVPQLGSSGGNVYISIKSIWMLESSRTKVSFPAETRSAALDPASIYITNNSGKADTIEVSGLYGGETIKVYSAAVGGRLLNTTSVPSSKTEAVINITQLGASGGSVYISVTNRGELESSRTKVDFPAEPRSSAPTTDNIMINNNVGKADTVYICNLYGGETIKVYNSAVGGRLLGTVVAPANAYEATVNIPQLGTASGSVYVSVTNKGEQESSRTKVDFSAEPKTEAISADDIAVTNNSGIADSVYVPYLTAGDVVKVYDAPKGGSILGNATVGSSKTDATISVPQLGRQSGYVYVSVTNKGLLESDRVKVAYAAESKSTAPSENDITVENNGGASDTITVANVHASDLIKVYDSAKGGNVIASATVSAAKTEVTITIPQLGSSTGSIYVSVTGKGSLESERIEVGFSAESKSAAPNSGNITITNNSGKPDTIYIINLDAGDVVKVYNAASGGKLLGSATVAADKTDATVTVAQLGAETGSLYVSVTSTNKVESSRVKVTYANEPVTDIIDGYAINVINNPAGKADAVQVFNLAAGDMVKVYDMESGGNLLGSATVSSSATDATVSITQLGTGAGNVYVTITSKNKLESKRIKVAYTAEAKSDAISAENVVISNNKAGTPDTIEVSGLAEGDVVKVYNSQTGGKLLGSGTVPSSQSYVTVTITQLGAEAGNVYISITGSNKLESDRVQASYPAEAKSGAVTADNINIHNNAAGTADTVEVTGLNGNDVVKIYDSARGGNLLGTSTVDEYSSYTTVTINQLGTAAGSVYVTVTGKNKLESDRVKVDYQAESKSDTTSSDDVIVRNYAGLPDTVQVNGLDIGDMVKVYDASRGGSLLGSAAVASSSYVTISIAQLGKTAGSIYITVTKKNKIESDRIKVDYSAELKSNAPQAEDISITNNVSASDTVRVSNLSSGDIVNVYDSDKAGSLLGTAAVQDYESSAAVTITQLGMTAGNVYVSVTRKGKQESDRTMAAYGAEPKSGSIDSGNIMVYNNAGAADSVEVTGLSSGDVVKVYDSAKGGSLLGTATVSEYESYAVVNITQLGMTAGNIYVSVTSKGRLEGERIAVAYASEQRSNPPAASNITVENNSRVADTVTVTNLEEGDLVKVYDSLTGGSLLGSAVVPSDSTEVTISITQLGTAAGKVYVAVASQGKLESERTIADYPEEATTDPVDSSNITVSNNVKLADTVTVKYLEPEDVVKIYNASSGGSLIGSGTVAEDATQVTISIQQLGSAAGNIYVSVTSKGKKESTRTLVKYLEEQKSAQVSLSNVIIVNNAGMSDTVTVTYLDSGDTVKVYDAEAGGNLLGSAAVASGSQEAAIRISQLGTTAGYVYITITEYGKMESERVKAYYTAEPVSDAPELGNITVTNNAGKSDTVYITGLTEYDVVKVYSAASGGSLLGTATVSSGSSNVTIKIAQLGTASGSIYVSVTSKGAVESSRTKASYNAEN